MTEREQLDPIKSLMAAMIQLEAQRSILDDAVVEAALASMREKLAQLKQEEAPRPALKGERKLVTIMFADISGFTALAETMDPEAVRDLMNACFDRLVPVINKYGGTVDKFIGDEVMALFGAPVVHENDPERALRAALEMMDTLTEFNRERHADLGLHMGINTGLVIAGSIGTYDRQEYSVIGDAVNLATRIREASERDQILVGPDTHRLTVPLFEFETLEPIQVKGRSEPLAIFRLLQTKAVPDKARGITGLESALVGRESEFRALQEALNRLLSGEGGIVTLLGEAGLGKSRLVAEVGGLTVEPPLQWVEGRCLSYGTSIAYLLWLDILRELVGTTTEEAPRTAREILRDRLQSLCPKHCQGIYPFLGRLMALPLEQEFRAAVDNLEGEQLKTGIFHAVETLVEGITRQAPLVIVCEDLHWADPTSIDLLEHLLNLTDRIPLLLICVFRPDRGQHCWRIRETAASRYAHRHTDLCLDPLSTAESEMLVDNLLRMGGLSRQLKERILDQAEGNPLYVEEILRSLMESGSIVHDAISGHWRASRDVNAIAIPDTLHGVLVARIDQLQEETKRVLQLAAVIGRTFLYRVLAAIAHEERNLDDHLTALQSEEMIRERAKTPELEYVFKHHLTQEAAYSGLLKRDRQIFHRRVAETLEEMFPDRMGEHVGLLAHHWERAEEPEKAIQYLQRAGDQARLAYAHEEAADYYQRALTLLKEQDPGQAARTSIKLGLTHSLAFDFRRAREAYEEGFALWQLATEVEPEVPPTPAPHPLRARWFDPLTVDPTMAEELVSGNVIEQLFCGLVELTLEMNIVPDVARSWNVSDGGRKYTFYLRDDVHWSDGVPLTAADFAYAWKRMLEPNSGAPLASLLYDIKGARAFHQGEGKRDQVGVQAVDRGTLVVELEEPTGYFLHLLTHYVSYAIPRHVVEVHGQAWTEGENIVTNGPFMLQTWQRGQSIVLLRNPAYHGPFKGNLQRVELSLAADPPTGLEMYEADDLDVLDLFFLPLPERNRSRQQHVEEYVSGPRLGTRYIGFNVSRPPFDDSQVRRAFVLATNREVLADVVLGDYEFPATGGFIPQGMPGYSPGIGLPYDPEQARQLLAEAGYPGGRGFPRVCLLTRPEGESLSEYLQAQWREILGVEIARETLEQTEFYDRLDKAPTPIFFLGWRADYPDPDSFLRLGVRWFYQDRWQHEAYDKLVEQARQVIDQGKRLELYRQADRILVEQVPLMPTSYIRNNLLVKPWVTRYPTSAIRQWFWKDVIIESH